MLRTTFAAALAAIAYGQRQRPHGDHRRPPGPDPEGVSREGRDLSFVIALNAPALESPSVSLNLAVDPKLESIYANRITPIGQR